jgi:hypothetical protein
MGGQEREEVRERENQPVIKLGVPFAPYCEEELQYLVGIAPHPDDSFKEFQLEGTGNVQVFLDCDYGLTTEVLEVGTCYVDPTGRYATPFGPPNLIYSYDDDGEMFMVGPVEPWIGARSDHDQLPPNLRCRITFEGTDVTYIGKDQLLELVGNSWAAFRYGVPQDVERVSFVRNTRLLLPPDPGIISLMRITFFLQEDKPSRLARMSRAVTSLRQTVEPVTQGVVARLDQIRGPKE